MRYTYLLINIFTIIIPFSRSFERKIYFYSKWKSYVPATIITASFFIIWDYYKTRAGVWGFNEVYTVGIKAGGLPLEEILFFITVPYACTFIYETVQYYMPGKTIIKDGRVVLFGLGLVFFALSFFLWSRVYTWCTLFISGLWLPVAAYIFNTRQAEVFILSYLISLIPMLIVNGLLTALPIVVYNNSQNLGIRVGTIPIEDFLYCLILLSMNIGLYEWFKAKQQELN